MLVIEGRRRARYDLVTSAHKFVLDVLPFRHPDSRRALAAFVHAVHSLPLSAPDVDAVLIELLAVLNRHTGGRLPSLVDRYLAQRAHLSEAQTRFRECVDDVIRYRGVDDGRVQQAIAIMEDRYKDPRLTPATVAKLVAMGARRLSILFRACTGVTCTEYLRDVRLDRAACLLNTTDKRIKEVWVEVGYNDASNFDHLFRKRFGVSPREYRARAIRSPDVTNGHSRRASTPDARPVGTQGKLGTVLIVDDDHGTRDTLETALRRKGYDVVVASSGFEGLGCTARVGVDVVLIDFHLGDMDGLEFLRKLRQRDGSRRPAAVIFTADWEVEDQASEIAALGGSIASKLCDLDQVERMVTSLCRMTET